MKKRLIGVVLILAGSGLLIFLKGEATFKSIKPERDPESSADSLHPLAIESFRQKIFESEGFLAKELVSENDNYSSYLVSFDVEGLTQYALMHVPQGQPPEEGWPVIVINHGYISPEVYSTINSYKNTSAFYANSGFLVFKPDYRGHDQSEGETGGILSRINYSIDVLYGLEALKKEANVNQQNIFMYGHSLGGEVVLRILEVTDQVKAASLWAPAVTDFPENVLHFTRRGNSDRAGRIQQEIKDNFSPKDFQTLATIDNLQYLETPVIIHHGTKDQSVPFKWSEALAAKLEAAEKPVQFYTYENDNHDIAGNFSTVLNRDIEFFRANMSSRPTED
jgi:dipeptidyl aminopeptidase/acylaminoacyl peptidase